MSKNVVSPRALKNCTPPTTMIPILGIWLISLKNNGKFCIRDEVVETFDDLAAIALRNALFKVSDRLISHFYHSRSNLYYIF